jgi:hypothetical protein
MWKRQLHQATDAGALAGAHALSQDATSVDAPVRREVDRNANSAIVVRQINTPPEAGDFEGNATAVEVIATTSRRLPFSSMFLRSPPVITARSVAARVRDGEHCVISLARDGVGVSLAGTANVTLGCGVAANSEGQSAIYFEGSSYLDGSPLTTVGGITSATRNIARGTQLNSYAAAQQDPMAARDLSVPTEPSSCSASNLTVEPNRPTVTLDPGRYCNGMLLKGNVTLNPGVYIIDKGQFYLSSKANVTGEGVTIILTGDDPSSIATVQVDGGARADIRAPTDEENADWHGILFYQDPDAAGQLSRFAGGSSFKMEGTVYMPAGNLQYTGGSSTSADCLFLVANRVSFTGNSTIRNSCPPGVDDEFAATFIRLVE